MNQPIEALRDAIVRPFDYLVGLDSRDMLVGVAGVRVPVDCGWPIMAGGTSFIGEAGSRTLPMPVVGSEKQITLTSTSTGTLTLLAAAGTSILSPTAQPCASATIQGPGGGLRLAAMSTSTWAVIACVGTVTFST